MIRSAFGSFALLLGVVFAACEGTGAGTGSDTATTSDTMVLDTVVAETSVATDVPEATDEATAGDTSTPADTVLAEESVADSEPDARETDDTTETTPPAVPLAGFGAISGACGVIDTELADPGPSLFVDHIDFGTDPYDDADLARLTAGSHKMIADGNAGGSSIMSEVFAYEVLARCELASLIKTETEIVYDTQGKITDFLVQMDGQKVGVSVTRAVAFPFDKPYTVEQATALLTKKLGDIQISTADVSAGDRWVKQILHVIAYGDAHATSIETAWNALDTSLRGDTIVFVTVSDGDDGFIY